MFADMTDKQARVLAAIVAYKAAHDGCAPPVRELKDTLGLSVGAIWTPPIQA